MKNIDGKKLLVFIGIIAIIAIVIALGITGSKNKETLNKEDKELAEKVVNDYFLKLTENYDTPYNGEEMLFLKDKTTKDDLSHAELISAGIKYATENELDTKVNDFIKTQLSKTNEYKNIDEFKLYKAAPIRDSINKLFGIDNYNSVSAINSSNFKYDFYYNYRFDVYLVKSNSKNKPNANFKVESKILKTTGKKDTATVKVAVAYRYKNKKEYIYSKDPNAEKVISKKSKEFPKDKTDEMNHYEFHLKKVKDRYVFESVNLVK